MRGAPCSMFSRVECASKCKLHVALRIFIINFLVLYQIRFKLFYYPIVFFQKSSWSKFDMQKQSLKDKKNEGKTLRLKC